MIMHNWFRSIHPPPRPRAHARVPEQTLFHSTRGHLIATRPIVPSDTGKIADLLAGLSAQSLFLRYCMPMPQMAPEMLAREVARLGQAHSARQFTVVALASVGGAEQAIGVAELVRDAGSPAVAELALVVADAYQRAGIGSALYAYLVAAARQQGLNTLRAMALAENTAVRRMIARSGAAYTAETRQGMTTIQIDLGSERQAWRV
jgi:acetyltransferase